MAATSGSRRVVIVGGGFAGLFAARRLKAPLQVTLIDRAANRPANPPPTITTRREPDVAAMARPDLSFWMVFVP